MRTFLASVTLGALIVFSAALFQTEMQAQAKSPGIVVTSHREVAKPAPQPVGPTAAELEDAIVIAEKDIAPGPVTEVSTPAKAAAKAPAAKAAAPAKKVAVDPARRGLVEVPMFGGECVGGNCQRNSQCADGNCNTAACPNGNCSARAPQQRTYRQPIFQRRGLFGWRR